MNIVPKVGSEKVEIFLGKWHETKVARIWSPGACMGDGHPLVVWMDDHDDWTTCGTEDCTACFSVQSQVILPHNI